MCLFFKKCKVTARPEAKAKYHVLIDANQLVLNCKIFKRFSHFRPFTHDIITQNTFHSNIMNLYRNHLASALIGKREGVDKESNKKWHRKEGVQSKKWCPWHKFFHVLFSVSQSFFLLGFSSGTNNIIASNKKSAFKKMPTSILK